MTKAQILALINQVIVANANNEITANVLNPVLVGMVEQINEITGALADLTAPANNLVNAINGVPSSSGSDITIFSGENNPNINPPANFSIADFYAQIVNGSPVALYIFTGVTWISLATVGARTYKTIESSSTILVANEYSDVYIYIGNSPTDQITLPVILTGDNANIFTFARITLINRSLNVINTGAQGYINFQGININTIPAESSVMLQSNGSVWYQIQ